MLFQIVTIRSRSRDHLHVVDVACSSGAPRSWTGFRRDRGYTTNIITSGSKTLEMYTMTGSYLSGAV